MEMTIHKITAERSGCTNGMDWNAEYEITFNYTRGRPEVRTLRNGDPGYPADPDELEVVSITPGAGDHGAFSDLAQAALEEWASDWLNDEGLDKALKVVAADNEDARDEAREAAREHE